MKNKYGHHILMCMYARTVGGAELEFIELANHLAKSHNIRLLCMGGDGALSGVALDSRIDLKIYSYLSRIEALAGVAKAWKENRSFIASVHVSTSFVGNLLGLLLAAGKKSVRLVSLQTVSAQMRRSFMNRRVLDKFDVLIAGANDIRDFLVNHGQSEDRIRVVHNWVDFTKRVAVASREEVCKHIGISPDRLIIGCVARLHPQKGHHYLIRAFPSVLNMVPDALLLIVGDGSERSKLEDEARSLGIEQNVCFAGTVLGQMYNDVLNAIDIYVQPSVFEGLPRTLLDAMYMRKPIVATSCNGNREAIEHEMNGLLVPSKDHEKLAEAVCRLIMEPALRLRYSDAARTSVVASFNMNSQLERIESLLSG